VSGRDRIGEDSGVALRHILAENGMILAENGKKQQKNAENGGEPSSPESVQGGT
jgi:hypothetical protein